MMQARGQAVLKAHGYRGLATFLSLWLTVAYLWLALFYPLMCAPYRSDAFLPLDQIAAFEHTITPFSVVMSAPVGWPLYVDSEAASSSTWLLASHDDTTGLALTFINVMSMPALSWLHWVQPIRTMTVLHTEFYKQVLLSPPEKPPRLFSLFIV
jgi:hypothetical protein